MLQMSSSSSSSSSCLHQPGRKPTGRAGQGAGRRKRRQRWRVHGQTERRIDGWIEAVDPSDEILGLGGWNGREVEALSSWRKGGGGETNTDKYRHMHRERENHNYTERKSAPPKENTSCSSLHFSHPVFAFRARSPPTYRDAHKSLSFSHFLPLFF